MLYVKRVRLALGIVHARAPDVGCLELLANSR
jgi:hypothetical protein